MVFLLKKLLPSGFASSLVLAGVALVALAGAVAYVERTGYNRGWSDAMASVAAVSTTAAKTAQQAQNKVDQCYDQGGFWNVQTGKCEN